MTADSAQAVKAHTTTAHSPGARCVWAVRSGKLWNGVYLRRVLMCSFDEAAIQGGPILRGDDLILEGHGIAQNRGEKGARSSTYVSAEAAHGAALRHLVKRKYERETDSVHAADTCLEVQPLSLATVRGPASALHTIIDPQSRPKAALMSNPVRAKVLGWLQMPESAARQDLCCVAMPSHFQCISFI